MADEFDRVRASLSSRGYALTDEAALGLPEKFRHNFGLTYFNDRILRHDEGDLPADRKRARDVIRYRWQDDDLKLEEFGTIAITNRADIPGTREHARVRLLEDPQAEELVRALLNLVPADRRQSDGTFGVNLFRTHTNVVTKPHHDNEQFIILYVLNRIGEGAETYLYAQAGIPDNSDEIGERILTQRLDPGQIIIFEDKKFKHGATPLVPPPGEAATRDVLVCTVDHWETYLAN
jgi:2OG-Fe dioxygenase